MSKPTAKLEAIFEAAVAFETAAQRADYLNRACPEPDLRREVESLLAAHERPDCVFADETVRGPSTLSENPGTVIGRYKLLEKLGEGGFGSVWLAEQKEPVRRKVALKVIKLGMDTRQVIARFEAERQALAMMDHPNIAKVLDGGATEAGRPYFVMELVRGVPITRFCDENRLTPRERLDLFIRVCHAVQHAHQKGIIHRDLKPSNVLVTLHDGVPVPKVIDFGIAKATQQELTDKTLHTLFQQFMGTPAYVSPEQAEMSGLDIDTRSDIYSLGVLLYELLTGRTPFDGKELLASGLDEMRRTIREKEPPRPSTRLDNFPAEERSTAANRRGTEPAKLAHLLRGDLDWIVMKCLEKDRARRYETANGLAADLQRHLNNEPVAARPPSTGYRFRKLVRRNKVAFTAAAAIFMVLLAGIATSTWQAIRATQAERTQSQLRERAEANEKKARAEAERADAVLRFLKSTLFTVNARSGRGKDVLLRDVLDDTGRKLDEGAFSNLPETAISLRREVGSTYLSLGELRKARLHLEKALATSREELGERHLTTAECLSVLASLEFDNSPRARELLMRALEIHRAISSEPSIELARTIGQLAAHETNGLLAQARCREALELYRQMGVDTAAETSWIRHNLAHLVRDGGDPVGAVPLFRATLEAKRRDTPGTLGVAKTLIDLAHTLDLAGRPDEVEAHYREALDILRKVVDATSPEMQDCVLKLTGFLSSRGEAGKAESVLLDYYAEVKADRHSSRGGERWILQRIVSHYQNQRSDKLSEWQAKLANVGKAAP